MKPNEYFPKWYLYDLQQFEGFESKDNGPVGVLCGWTLGKILKKENRDKFSHLQEFILSLYCLNLGALT